MEVFKETESSIERQQIQRPEGKDRHEAIQKVTRIEDLPGTTNDEVQALLDL